MKKVAVYGQSYTLSSDKEIKVLLSSLEEKSIIVFLERKFYTQLRNNKVISKEYPFFSNSSDLDSSFDLFFSIGGDGTMLRAVTYVRDLDIPILGINTGRLGFLATVNKNEIEKAIIQLANNQFSLQERTILSLKTKPKAKELNNISFALNEISIVKKDTTSMIGIKTYLDNEYLTNYWADGLIIATPTGSTGYSLSCNGPVISPKSKSLIITPIAPHNLNARPMVIPDDTEIELEVSAREDFFLISLDSRIVSLPTSTKIHVEKTAFTIKTVLLSNQTFLQTLRSKLLWGEDARNESNL